MTKEFTRIQVESMSIKDPVKFFIPGSPNKNNVAYAKKAKGGIEIWNDRSKVVIPMEFPTGKKAIELEVSECEPHVVTVYYESTWPEFRLMRYACSTLVCHDGQLGRTIQLQVGAFCPGLGFQPRLYVGQGWENFDAGPQGGDLADLPPDPTQQVLGQIVGLVRRLRPFGEDL
ncbi:MAG: hypothetical protein WCJ59_02315, partial [bacterium]